MQTISQPILNNQSEQVTLLDYIQVIVKRWKLIAIVIGSATVIAIIVSLFSPKIYSSTTSIMPPQSEGPSLLSQLPGGLAGMAGSLGIGATTSDLWVGILKSENVSEAIVRRFNLVHDYKAKTVDEVTKALTKMVKINKAKEGIVFITIEDTNPKRAAILANSFVEELDRVNRGLVTTAGGRMRAFVEKRLRETEVQLTKTEEAIKTFQENHSAVRLDNQSQVVIEAIGGIKGQLMAKEVELQTMLSYTTENHPKVGLLKAEVNELKVKLIELEEGKALSRDSNRKDIFIPTSKIPNLSLQYARLLRETKIQQTLYDLLTQQYEMARIQEAKDTPTVQVLDKAKVPEKRIKPQRKKMVMLATFASLFFAIFLCFFMEYIESIVGKEKLLQVFKQNASRRA
jgi:uncharacterized protein involved in exopolysaccharide biosynthesis